MRSRGTVWFIFTWRRGGRSEGWSGMSVCPHCKAEVPANWGRTTCPSCEEHLPRRTSRRPAMLTPLSSPRVPSNPPPARVPSVRPNAAAEDRWDLGDAAVEGPSEGADAGDTQHSSAVDKASRAPEGSTPPAAFGRPGTSGRASSSSARATTAIDPAVARAANARANSPRSDDAWDLESDTSMPSISTPPAPRPREPIRPPANTLAIGTPLAPEVRAPALRQTVSLGVDAPERGRATPSSPQAAPRHGTFIGLHSSPGDTDLPSVERGADPMVTAAPQSPTAPSAPPSGSLSASPAEPLHSSTRVAFACAGLALGTAASLAGLRDSQTLGAWGLPALVAVVLAVAPVAYATRALLVFAPSLPALAVQTMAIRDASLSAAFLLLGVVATLPAALLFRSAFRTSWRARGFVAVGIVFGVAWIAHPFGGGILVGGSHGIAWFAARAPALTLAVVLVLSTLEYLGRNSRGGAASWAALMLAWSGFMVAWPLLVGHTRPAADARATAIASVAYAALATLVAMSSVCLLAVYSRPGDRGRKT